MSFAIVPATEQTSTFRASGNVGIGTTIPNAALDLATSLPKIMLEAAAGGNVAVMVADYELAIPMAWQSSLSLY